MKVIRAKTAGFCFGVDRAVKLTYDLLAEGRRVATLGPLIHNPQVVQDLETKGALTCDDVDAVPDGYEVIIRSHGVPRNVYEKISTRGLAYHDATCPRMSVFRSNKQIYVQVIDDLSGKTLAAASSLGMTEKMPKKEQAAKVGELIAKKAQEAGITTVVFDRNGYLYHGRVKEVADAARNGGLKF